VSDVGAGALDDARVAGHLFDQLPVTDVQGGHLGSALAEQDLGEAPRAGADVQGAPTRHRESLRPEGLEGAQQFVCRPPHPRVRRRHDLEDRVVRDGRRHPQNGHSPEPDAAVLHELRRLGARPR
jgi:hypothetical protein